MASRSLGRVLLLACCLLLSGRSLSGQSEPECLFFCPPEVKLEPALTVENVFGRHRVAEVIFGQQSVPVRVDREVVFETILAVDIPTIVPRLSFTFETIFVPFASGDENPFTGVTAPELGRSSVRDNSPEVEFEVNLHLLRANDTGGWVGSHLDVVDKISPAERAGDVSAYTHKLNLELDTAVHVFSWLPDGNWLRRIEVEGSLDYVASGLPRRGDLVGSELYLDDATPWSASLVLVVPIIPLR